MVIRLAENVLPQETFSVVSRLMLGRAFLKAREYEDIVQADGTPVMRLRCTAPKIIKQLVDSLGPHVEHLIPGFMAAKPPAHVCFNENVNDTTEAHLDGQVGETGFVAVYSVGAPGLLGIR